MLRLPGRGTRLGPPTTKAYHRAHITAPRPASIVVARHDASDVSSAAWPATRAICCAGTHKPIFAPHSQGDFVIIVNAGQVCSTGKARFGSRKLAQPPLWLSGGMRSVAYGRPARASTRSGDREGRPGHAPERTPWAAAAAQAQGVSRAGTTRTRRSAHPVEITQIAQEAPQPARAAAEPGTACDTARELPPGRGPDSEPILIRIDEEYEEEPWPSPMASRSPTEGPAWRRRKTPARARVESTPPEIWERRERTGEEARQARRS